MDNATVKVAQGKVVITIDPQGPTVPSATGKTSVVASSRGNVPIPGTENANGDPLILGFNAYYRRRPE